jgi:predicted exporter
VRYLLAVREPTADAVLRRTERMTGELQGMVAEGALGGFDMASRYLPSEAAQEARRGSLPNPAALRAAFDQAIVGLPFRPDAFAPFFRDVEASRTGPVVTLDDFRDANLSWRLDPYLFGYEGEWVGLIVPTGVKDPGRLERFVREKAEPGLFYLDLKRTSEKLAETYRNEALGWLSVGAVLGVTILFAGLRNVRQLLGVVTPVVLAAAVTIAILVAFGVKLSILHLLSLLLVFGVGLDYALFLGREHESAEDRQRSHFSAILCNFTTVSLFALLAFSNMPILHGIGVTVALGTSLCLLLAFIFVAQPAGEQEKAHG